MSAITTRLMVGLSVLACLSVLTAAEPEPVDQFGNMSNLMVHGAYAFAPQQLRDVLTGDFPTMVAAHPRASLESLPRIVQERLLAGYHQAGYADARVEVRINRAQHCLEATIDEGPVYLCGDVRIEGAVSIPVAELIERLTLPYVPEKAIKPVPSAPPARHQVDWLDRNGRKVALKEAVWPHGKPARMSAMARNYLNKTVQAALWDFGFGASQFQFELAVDRATRTVELVVTLIDEGPPTVIEDIEIVGAIRNGRQDILDYLELRPGSLLTRRERSRLKYMLWRSGRFLDLKLEPKATFAGDSPARLRITLIESPDAPGLNQPLTREQQALLRLSEWLANEDGWQADLYWSTTSQTGQTEMILSPSHGFSSWSRAVSVDGSLNDSASLAVLSVPGTLAFLLPGRGQRFEISRPNTHINVMVCIDQNDDPEQPDKYFRLKMLLERSSNNDQLHEHPLQMCFTISPPVAIALSTRQFVQPVWKGDQLTLRFRNDSIAVDAKTGRLLQLTGSSKYGRIHGEFREGAFAKSAAPLLQQRETAANRFQADRPLSSLLMVLTEEQWIRPLFTYCAQVKPALDTEQWRPDSWRFARRLIELDVLQPIDQWIVRTINQDETKFIIPHDYHSRLCLNLMIGSSLPLADHFFPRGTWPWIVWRETGLTIAGHGSHTTEELRRAFYSDEVGPVCHLVIAWVLVPFKPGVASLFAERGLTMMDVDCFRHDYHPLLDRNSLAGNCLLRAGEILRELEPDEVQQLTDNLPEPWRTSIASLADHLRQQRGEPIDTALSSALHASWNHGWSALVAQQLSRLKTR